MFLTLFCWILLGLVALLYSLLHQGTTTRIAPSPLPLGDCTVSILEKVFKTLNTIAMVDIQTFQVGLSRLSSISLALGFGIYYLGKYMLDVRWFCT